MKEILLGNEAIARGAYESGVRVCSSYPGTPSTEITESVAKNHPSIYSEWASNEKVGYEVALGASIAGARAMTCMKHVGLNVAADPLFTSVYTGVGAGFVLVVADDPGMHSSQNEQDSRNYARSAKFPMLEPSNSQECKDFVKYAFLLSERFDTPVGVRLTTRIAHSRAPVALNEPVQIQRKPYIKNMPKYVMMPATAMKRHPIVEQRISDIAALAPEELLYQYEPGEKSVGIITSGICYQYVKEAYPNASVLKLGVIWPMNVDFIRQFAASVDRVIVVEELDPFIERFMQENNIPCEGKALFSLTGEYSVAMLKHSSFSGSTLIADLPKRPPVMCAGCSHKGIFMSLKRLGAIVVGDIGCYTLGALPPISAMDTCVCMGASVTMAHGFDKGTDHELSSKTVAVIGDSTFLHTGINGLIHSVYNQSRSTILILDNSITGMTGHQQNPSSGFDIHHEQAPQIDLHKLCEALGVPSVRMIDPADTYLCDKVIAEEMAKDCLSVIIAKRPCAIIPQGRGEKNIKAIVDDTLCKRCGLCLKCMCPALTEGDQKRILIDIELCNACGLCEKYCKFGALRMGDIGK